MSSKHWVLTDVSQDIYHERFEQTDRTGPALAGSPEWSVKKRRLRGGPSDGVDVIDVDNGRLAFSILPTRGMGLWKGHCEGLHLGWQSPVRQPVNPMLINALDRGNIGWLAGFNEWLCRCGLESMGAPGTDIIERDGNRSQTNLTLHGKIANIPAHFVDVTVSTERPGTISVSGIVDESMLFGPSLRLISTVQTRAGSTTLTVIDEVTNLKSTPVEFELLYHINLGRPFLEAGSLFSAPVAEMAPRDAWAATDIDHYQTFRAPESGYVEQCYLFDLATQPDDTTLALLKSAQGDKGVCLKWNKRELPCFTLWKNTQAEEDGCVTGLEPGTNFPNLKTYEREQKRLITLAPGASHRITLHMEVLPSAASVTNIERDIAEIQGHKKPQIHREPHPRFGV